MKPSILIAWENGPTGGVSSGEVIAILLMECALLTCITISLKSNFTNHFGTQKSSDLPPVHSGLVLTRGVTNYLFGHCFKCIDGRLIADVPGISRDVFKSDLKIHIGLIR